MKHVILGFVVLMLVPLAYRFQLLKLKKSFKNKLGVVVFSFAGSIQVFVGVCKLESEGINISDKTAIGILVVSAIIWCTCLFFAFKDVRGRS